MTATIIRTELLKSINQTMTVVVVEAGDRKSGRVLFADSFGNVKSKREFYTVWPMEVFIAEQLAMEHDWRSDHPTA